MLRGRCWFLHEVLSRDEAATAVDDVEHLPKERVQNRNGEQTVAVPVPQFMDAIGEVTQRAPERMHSRVVEQIADLAVPLILEKILEIVQLVPLERIKDHIVEHIRGRAGAPDQGDVFAARAGARAESRWGADR